MAVLTMQEQEIEGRPATAAEQLLRVCASSGVKYIFSNLGSDHPAFISAFAKLRADGQLMPEVVVCPHEMTTLSAADGYAMVTGQPQLVLVHVDVGTQNLGASVHNAARGRIPAIVVAGLSPVSTDPAVPGHRNEYIHYTQDTTRQHDIVAPFMKWMYELRAPGMTEMVVRRALQVAMTAPPGPVYLTGAREVWEAATPPVRQSGSDWAPARLGGIAPEDARELHEALCRARRPLVLTSYAGRQPEVAARLVALAERFGVGVMELGPQYVSFPGSHACHLGYQRNALVGDADLILLLDVDVPWMESKVTPRADARVFHVDIDPLKEDLGYWHFPVQRSFRASAGEVLAQLLALEAGPEAQGRQERLAWIASARERSALALSPDPVSGAITPVELTRAVRRLVNERTVVLVEAPSHAMMIASVLRTERPGGYYQNHGAGLGWAINAAVGVKLAAPESEVITLVGDGSFQFGVPGSAYWVAGACGAPQLTVIYNNGGWKSPRVSTMLVHPDGPAERNDTYWIAAGEGTRFEKIAEATGAAVGFRVEHREELVATLAQALETVRAGRSAVVNVLLAPVTGQALAGRVPGRTDSSGG
jgi:acetolactate synthase I/II/III large subunit